MMCRFPAPITLSLVFALAAACPANLRALTASVDTNPDGADEESRALIATADFNRDGIADVARIVQPDRDRSGSSVLEIRFGQKDGSFESELNRTLEVPNPQSIATGDFNGDGNPDLLIGDMGGAVIELLGDGKGNLKSAGEVAHVGSPVSIAVGDFNHDGFPDAAVSDFRGNTVTILLGSGGGSFRIGWSFALPQRGTIYYLAAADFNGDGVSDLAITSGEEGMFVVMLANGNGTFTYAPNLSNIRDPNSYCPT